ncbi:hypothetical protein ACIA8O_04505 [Kitasatospora sp. NPDC051853]|uniref:hypothetical protein n=1 Tax=Kitasatospora sp. NPDC051853 TaxID=3364058 RepID=UPI0037A78B44
MTNHQTAAILLLLTLAIAVLLSLLAAAGAAWLARWGGETVATAARRAAVAFAGALTLLTAVLAFGFSALTHG